MTDKAALLHASFVTRLTPDGENRPTANGNALEYACKIQCFWSPVIPSPKNRRQDYALVFLDVRIAVESVPENDGTAKERNDGLNDLLGTVQLSTPLIPGATWSGRVFLLVPLRSGYFARTKCFQQRFTGCTDLGILHDRTIFGQRVDTSDGQELQDILDGCVFMLVRPEHYSNLSDEATFLKELHARISFHWLLDHEPQQKTLAIVDGHLNLKSYLPFYNSATALGIRFVLLDSPQHWIRDTSLRHLYHDFVSIDMTPDESFHERIATAVKTYGHVDGICAIASYCLLPVSKAAIILGLPTELPGAVASAVNKYETRLLAGGAEPTTLVRDLPDLEICMTKKSFIPRYPLMIKPGSGTGSAHVYKANNESELREGVRRTCKGSNKKALIEAYVDGPEVDVNFVLLDGEIIFFEISDDFPSPGDTGTLDSDFWENTNVLPSKLPANEYAIVRENLYQLLLQMGFRTGVFHLEARVRNSSMAYSEKDGSIDLRTSLNNSKEQAPRCFLIEVNPRPPGMPCILATAAAYGVNMYDLHLLASLGDHERLRALARPFDLDTTIPNHARAWSQLIWLRADKGGICASDDVCGEWLQRLPLEDRAFVTESMCFFRRGQRIPDPKQGVVNFGAFFVVTSRGSRHDVLRVSKILQQEFSIPIESNVY